MPDILRSEQILRIESLGDNCELGFVLRELGCEAGSLFRWARVTPELLLAVLRAGFAGIYDYAGLTPIGRDMVDDGRYGIGWHTQMRSVETDGKRRFVAEDEARRKIYLREIRKIRYLIAKFTARVKLGGIVFVIKSNDGLAETTIRALLETLTAMAEGAPFVLLEMRQSDDPAEIGTVAQRTPQWLAGYVSRHAPYDHADEVDLEAWCKVLAATFALFPCPDWSARLAQLTIAEPKLELRFPFDKTLDLSLPIYGDLRAGTAILAHGNDWCRAVNGAFRLHGAAPGEPATTLRWVGVHPSGAMQLCAALRCPIDDSVSVDVTATVRDEDGKSLGEWRGTVAPKEPEEIGLDFVPGEYRSVTVELSVRATRALAPGERAVVDVLPPVLYPAVIGAAPAIRTEAAQESARVPVPA